MCLATSATPHASSRTILPLRAMRTAPEKLDSFLAKSFPVDLALALQESWSLRLETPSNRDRNRVAP